MTAMTVMATVTPVLLPFSAAPIVNMYQYKASYMWCVTCLPYEVQFMQHPSLVGSCLVQLLGIGGHGIGSQLSSQENWVMVSKKRHLLQFSWKCSPFLRSVPVESLQPACRTRTFVYMCVRACVRVCVCRHVQHQEGISQLPSFHVLLTFEPNFTSQCGGTFHWEKNWRH